MVIVDVAWRYVPFSRCIVCINLYFPCFKYLLLFVIFVSENFVSSQKSRLISSIESNGIFTSFNEAVTFHSIVFNVGAYIGVNV
jgi:hypothetical protein